MRPSLVHCLVVLACQSVPLPVLAEHESGKWDCNGTQLEVNYCAAAKFTHAETELESLVQRQLGQLDVQDEKSRLQDAQRAWLVFRQKACAYEAGPQAEGGTSWPLDHFSCMERITSRRVLDLKEYIRWSTPGCGD